MNNPALDDSTPEDRRYRQRLTPIEAIPVKDDFRHNQLGVIGNLSVSGMMLVCDDALPEGMTCQVRFGLPERPERDFVIGVEVLWTQANAEGESFWSGLRIIDINPGDHDALVDLLEQSSQAHA